MQMLYVVIVVVFMWLYTFVKIDYVVCFKLVNFMDHKVYFNKAD